MKQQDNPKKKYSMYTIYVLILGIGESNRTIEEIFFLCWWVHRIL